MSTRATGVVGVAILSSRVLGLIREMVFAGLFGAGRNLDAFLMAFRLPNLLRDLFAEGALSTAFITTFSKKIAVEGDESAWRLANKVATLTAVVHEHDHAARHRVRTPTGGSVDVGELVAGQNGAHDFAHADHVAVHAAGVARSAGDGNAERETCVRAAGDGIELFQSRLDHRRGGDRLLDRSAFRRALTHRFGDRHAHRRRVAVDRAISVAVESRLQISCRIFNGATKGCARC